MSTLKTLIDSIEDISFQSLVADQNYPAIRDYLNARKTTVQANPEPQGTVPLPIDMAGLRALLTPSEVSFFLRPRSINTWLADAIDNPAVTDNTPLMALVDHLIPNATGEMPLLGALRSLVDDGDRALLASLATVLVQTGDSIRNRPNSA